MTERGLRAGNRRRRIAAVVALGALALGALSACRADAGTAAFVGDTRFTQAQINSAVAGTKDAAASRSDLQHQYVTDLVYVQVLRRYAAAQGIDLTEPTADLISQTATDLGAPESNPFVKAHAQAQTYGVQLAAKADPVTPTDAELQPMYQRAVAAGLADPKNFAQFKTTILSVPDFARYVGLQKQLEKAVATDNISINPRYAPTCTANPCPGFHYDMLPLGNGQGQQFSSVILPLGPANVTAPVIDVPATNAPASAPSS